jgi:hypothetical protein
MPLLPFYFFPISSSPVSTPVFNDRVHHTAHQQEIHVLETNFLSI